MWTSSTPLALGLSHGSPPSAPFRRQHRRPLRARASPPAAPRPAVTSTSQPAAGSRSAAGSRRSSCSAPHVAAAPAARHLLHRQLGALERGVPAPPARRRTRARTGTTWRRWPTRSSTSRHAAARARGGSRCRRPTRRSRARALSRSSAAGRRRAGPSPACRRTRSPPAPSRAAPSAPRRSRRPARSPAPRAARRAPRRRPPARRTATSLPSLATYIGSIPRISAAPATAGSTGTAASRTIIATPEARASSLSTEATPPRVASRMQRRRGAGGVQQRVDRRPQRARVGLDRRRRARTRRARA